MKIFLKKTLAVYILGIIVLYLVYSNLKIFFINIKDRQEILISKAQIISEKRKKVQLTKKFEDKNKERIIETKARVILGLIKKGEVAYRIIKK